MVNLSDIGPVAPFLATRDDLARVLAAAEDIVATTRSEDLNLIVTEWETGLAWQALGTEPVGDAWYCRALLCLCLRGLRGEIEPKIWPFFYDN